MPPPSPLVLRTLPNMVFVTHVVAVLAGLSGVLAECKSHDCLRDLAATTSAATAAAATPVEACAVASSAWAVQREASPSTIPTIPAELAYECLNTVPLGKEAGIELVDSLVPYIEWQSDAAYKADPPKGYPYPAYDIFAALAEVKAKLVANKYASEYEFQEDLYTTVFCPGHDGHFVFYPDALTTVFTYKRQRSLVSISEDGTSLPVIKIYEDVMASPKKASVVTQIQGIDAVKYVEDFINQATYNQDPDAAYNSMFYELAGDSMNGARGYFTGRGRTRFIYPGANTTFTFANGSSLTLENKASVVANLTGVTDGASFYEKFCTPKPLEIPISHPERAPTTKPGYPRPVVATRNGKVAGYFLHGIGLEDVAVIELLGFSGDADDFQNVIRDFFAKAKAAGRKKLLVSFFENGGGTILLGYEFFRQLFPQIMPDGYSRFKETDGFEAMAEIDSARVAGVDPFTESDPDLVSDYEIWFNSRYDLNLTNQAFATYGDKFDPHVYKNTSYTNILRWNLNDNLTTTNDTFGLGIQIPGYGDLANVTQPFAPEDIIILYDGVCASTCTLAGEMLRIQGGVKSISFGGRPTPGLIQGMGGIKGAQVLDYRDIYNLADYYSQYANTTKQKAALERYKTLPIQRSLVAAVNVRDQILRDNLEDGLPAQYVIEEADCRLYWTLPMLNDATSIWKAAAEVAFHGKPCVAGGISRPNMTTEGVTERIGGYERLDTAKRPGMAVDSKFFKAKFIQEAIP